MKGRYTTVPPADERDETSLPTQHAARSLPPLFLSHRAYCQLAIVGRPSHGHDLGHLDGISFRRRWLHDGIQMSELHFSRRPSPQQQESVSPQTGTRESAARLLDPVESEPTARYCLRPSSLPLFLRFSSTFLERRPAATLPASLPLLFSLAVCLGPSGTSTEFGYLYVSCNFALLRRGSTCTSYVVGTYCCCVVGLPRSTTYIAEGSPGARRWLLDLLLLLLLLLPLRRQGGQADKVHDSRPEALANWQGMGMSRRYVRIIAHHIIHVSSIFPEMRNTTKKSVSYHSVRKYKKHFNIDNIDQTILILTDISAAAFVFETVTFFLRVLQWRYSYTHDERGMIINQRRKILVVWA